MTRVLRLAKLLALPAFVVAGLFVVQAVIAVPTATITPVVVDDAPAGACVTVRFDGAASDDEAPATTFDTFAWTVDAAPAAGPSTTQTFAAPGPHAVNLIATSTGTPGATATADLSYTFPNTPPTAGVTAPGAVEPDEAFTATGSGTDNGRIDLQEWDLDDDGLFGEAGEPDGPSAQASFATSGAHEIHFRTTDNCGAVSTVATATVNVEDAAPLGTLDVAPEAVLRNQQVTLTATVSDPGGTIASYEWDLNGNSVFDEAGEPETTVNTLQTSFPTAGNHRVRVRVTDNGGNQVILTNFVRVNFPPEADFSIAPSPPLIGDAVTFRATRAQDPDGSVVTYEWDLDGNGSYEHTGATPPARTFNAPGARTASLRVTDNSGEQAVVSKPFTVGSNMRPEASFRFSPRSPKVGEQVEFTSTSDDADDRIVKHEWDFNRDGRFDAQGRVVTRSFSGPGRKLVVLRVTDSRGAVETSSQTVSVQRKTLKAPVDVKRSLGYIREDWGVTLVVLYVKVPARTTVKVACKGRGCPSGTFTKRSKAKRAKLRFDRLRGSVRAGGKITVISTRKGHVPAYDTYIVRGGNRSPLLREGCKPPGAKRVRALSSCSG
jgi:hypothetical protein